MSRSPLLPALLLAIAAVPACGSDDGPDPIDPPKVIEESELRARLDAWKQSITKDCDVDAIFGDGNSDNPHIDLDAALVLSRLHGKLSITDGADTLILAAPPALTHSGFGSRNITVAHDGKQTRDTALGVTLTDGICTVTFDGVEAYRGRVWPSLPVLAHIKPSTVGTASAPEGIDVYVADGATTGAAYLGLPQLEVVNDALAADHDRATALLSRVLSVPTKDLGAFVVEAAPQFDSVEADAATAPFPLYKRVNGATPIDSYDVPLVPVDMARADDWAPATTVTRTLRLRIPRPALDVAGSAERADRPLELTVRVALEAKGDKLGSRVTEVSAPADAIGGAQAATTCFRQTTAAALGYVARPQTQLGSIPVIPNVLAVGGGPTVQAAWFNLPCRAFVADLGAAVLADKPSLEQLGRVLDRSSYFGSKRAAGITPRGWDWWLAYAVPTDAALSTLIAATPQSPVLAAAARTQHAMFADKRYTAAAAGDQTNRRALLWSLGFQCGAELTPAQLDEAMNLAGDKISGYLWSLNRCPWTP